MCDSVYVVLGRDSHGTKQILKVFSNYDDAYFYKVEMAGDTRFADYIIELHWVD